ncbi:Maff2 family mobile element protein, partial [Blautia luti]
TPPPAIEPVSYTYLGMKQLMAGGGVVLIGLQLIPLLSGLFS